MLANILARRLQRNYRKYQKRKKIVSRPVDISINKQALLKQAKACLDNKKLDDRTRARSLTNQPSITNDENNAEDRRRAFAKSKTAITSINQSDETR